MIETGRLILRGWQAEDRDPFLAMGQSPAVMEHLGGLQSPEQVDEAIGRVRACQAANGHCLWAVERKMDGAFLGFCGLKIGNVGPSLGQSYIVDSFMTVVVGGVGSLVGTVCSALAIGTSDQVLQQLLGSPVLGKIIVLGGIILFLQWKPGGLFAIRSRTLD